MLANLGNRFLRLRLKQTAVEINIETILKHPSADRPGFQLQHVDAPLSKDSNDLIQRARFMVDDEIHADLICLLNGLLAFCHTEKPRCIQLIILYPFL